MFRDPRASSAKTLIQKLKEKVLSGGEISYQEALSLAAIRAVDDLDFLRSSAHELTLHFKNSQPDLCALINAKSYLCGEDCKFCSQSAKYDTGVQRYPMMSPEKIVEAAKRCEENGARNFCVVTSGETLSAGEFDQVRKTFQLLSEETGLGIDGSLGNLTEEQISELKKVGLRRFNHNLQCSREFYPEIVSTHTYDERMETLDFLKKNDVEICSGGIFGMGESPEDRLKLAFELKRYAPHCFPVNILNPRPGTPLAGQPPIDPAEAIKMIATYRFIHPHANIKLAGGKELNLGIFFLEKALKGGANGLVVGGYLTTCGNPIAEDFALLKRAGYIVERESAVAQTA
ncbi:MAG TPA: biotin synthase BioB [Candidatus Omnitrophota bacterium]|nr:biotin synthase BioB [Candidatus Omnitrophota bacterium]